MRLAVKVIGPQRIAAAVAALIVPTAMVLGYGLTPAAPYAAALGWTGGWWLSYRRLRTDLLSGRRTQMRLVYIAHPLRGDWARNIAAAKAYSAHALLLGYGPMAPYIVVDGVLDDSVEEQRRAGLAFDLAVIARCDEVWLCGPRISEGMRIEEAEAVRLGIPVRRMHFDGPDLSEVRREWFKVTPR